MAEFVMPSLGADMVAGTLVSWLKHPGEHVDRGDLIAEVDTDKGVIEVEVFTTGVVEELLVPEGAKVPVGTPLALIREPGEEATARSAAPAERARISPAARQLARELGVDEKTLAGSGPGGAVTRQDVERAAPRRGSEPAPTDTRGRMRQAIAAAMARSNREIPHYYVSHTMDLSPALAWLERHNAERPPAERVLFGALLLRAVALALRGFPELNARWENDALVPSAGIHVGMAIALRDGGLVIPAIEHTDQLDLDRLMQKLRDLVERARRGQLRSSELSLGTITVTSLGDRAALGVAGVIYPPQTALVGFGSPKPRPWVVEGQVVPRTLVDVTLAADHRASDGHHGSRFLLAVERQLLGPEASREGSA